jgi:hypothetical protein
MFVVGRVLDQQGRPVSGATVIASTRATLSGVAVGSEAMTLSVIGQSESDGSGRFRLDAPRTSSTRDDEFMTIALAPGFGVGWAAVDPDAEQPAADIALPPEQVIQGRLFDMQGRPAQGVVVSVAFIQYPPRSSQQFFEGPHYDRNRVTDIPSWPKPAITDADGRFQLHGVGRPREALLSILDPRFARQTIDVTTDDAPGAKSITMALQPAKIITGRVTYADTGKPVPGAQVRISASGAGQRGSRPSHFQADADGRFRANPTPGDSFSVYASPPRGQIYLTASKRLEWPRGAVEQSVDLALTRGVVIRGKVSEQGSRRPIAGASVVFVPQTGAPNDGSGRAETGADGSFELAAVPRAGHLVVQASIDDFVLREIGNRELFQGQAGGTRLYSHSFIACDPKAAGIGLELQVALRRGVTAFGRIIGPDGQPVHDTWIIGRAALAPSPGLWRSWRPNYHSTALNGRFELHGLDPDGDIEVPVYFLQPARKLGALVVLSAKSAADGPVTIRLLPCGAATARLVDSESRPVAGYRDEYSISMSVALNGVAASGAPSDSGRLISGLQFLSQLDTINYAKPPESDQQGRITFPALIPGASYRIVDRSSFRAGSRSQVRKEFTVKAGETLNLGDILIEKPQAR